MKSEKAKAIIRESDFYFQIDGVTFHEARAMMKKDAIRAVEIAEQERGTDAKKSDRRIRRYVV